MGYVPFKEKWIGIPPMHHETSLSEGSEKGVWVRCGTGRRWLSSSFPRRSTCSARSQQDEPYYVPGNDPYYLAGDMNATLLERMQFHMGSPGPPLSDSCLEDEECEDSPSTLWPPPHPSQMPSGNKRVEMPLHLVPFAPYIEKDMRMGPLREQRRTGDIPVATIRNWLNVCSHTHGPCDEDARQCGSGPWSEPIWLIDVRDECIVPAPKDARYIALSYVWGEKSAPVCNTNKTVEVFRRVKGLSTDSGMLPQVIVDTIELLRALGERYLWVDRFCIGQDDSPAKQSQLNAMGNIYARAYFTLVATQNDDAADGLYGHRRVSADRQIGYRPQPVSSEEGMAASILLDQSMDLMKTKWYSRGWTFQEYLLSRRRVVFHNDTVNWECSCASWCEGRDPPTIVYPPNLHLAQTETVRIEANAPATDFAQECLLWPNMFRYARLVSLFNRRNLTYPEDVFDAFAGVLSHLSRSFPGGFISGLPQMCFDAALLWQPWTVMSRRRSVGRPASHAVLPSWSWAGWTGNMNSESWRSAANYLLETDDEENAGQQCSWRTISTVEWTYSIDVNSPRKTIWIAPEFAQSSLDYDESILPKGWSKVQDGQFPSQALYSHTCDPHQPFRYPIPIRDHTKAHIPPTAARFLHCNTSRGFLSMGSAHRNTISDCPAVDLVTLDKRWAGVLRLNCSTSDVGPLVQRFGHGGGEMVELIELSEGVVYDQPIEEKSFDEWNSQYCPRRTGKYEFINAMWIEWDQGIAYRRALGRVEKGIWNEVMKERIDVTLG